MVGGFNTNIRYRGRIFHVQTEDGGAESPNVITLLYQGGAILFSKKTSYATERAAADLETRVRDLMELQHSAMVQALKTAKLDEKLGLAPAEAATNSQATTAASDQIEFGAGVVSRRSLDEVILAHFGAS